MAQTPQTSPAREAFRRGRAEAIKSLLDTYAASPNEDLLAQMMVTICRLAEDGADRGDLKILNTSLSELRYSLKVFAPYAEVRKVSIFGSARTPEDHPQYLQAKEFAELMARQGWMVITGAGDGIMRAGHHGARKESSFGVAIRLPFEQSANTIIARDEKLVNFKYFFTRKLVFVKEAHAIVLFPGGFGTQDEGFEALTLVQTGKSTPVPIVLCDEPGGTYWQHWRTYVKAELLGNGMIDREDLDLFKITDDAEEAVDEIMRFYRRYHSSRFVGDRMVIRLQTPLSSADVDSLNDTFADLLTSGRFELSHEPLEEEEGAYPGMTRLVFSFHRRSIGRLRKMINTINEIA